MNGLLKHWLRQSRTSVLLLSLCLPPAMVAQGRGDEQLFTLMPAPGGVPSKSIEPSRGSGYASGFRTGAAPIKAVPTPLTPIPYTEGATGNAAGSMPGTLPNHEKILPGKVYYFDSAGRPLRAPPGQDIASRAARPKFDYSLAPIQPAARPLRNYVSGLAVAAESSALLRKAPASQLVRQDRVVSADATSPQRTRSSVARNEHSGQGPILPNVRRVVTVENGNSRYLAQTRSQPAPKCPNCGKRKPATAVASSGANVRR